MIHGVWDYGKFAATFAVEFVNGYDGVGATFYGTKMTLHADADAGRARSACTTRSTSSTPDHEADR